MNKKMQNISSLGMPTCNPRIYSRIFKRLSLGMPMASLLFHQHISGCLVCDLYYSFTWYVLLLHNYLVLFYLYWIWFSLIWFFIWFMLLLLYVFFTKWTTKTFSLVLPIYLVLSVHSTFGFSVKFSLLFL